MANYVSMDNLRFLLFDVHQIQEVNTLERFQDYDKESMNLMLDAVKSWADQDWYPYYREMDEKPAYFKDGKVFSHPQVKKVIEHAGANGWIGNAFDYQHGGAQMPTVLHASVNHILEAANNHLAGYIGLTAGSANLITTFGTPELFEKFVPNMLAGKWSGTMCLTEPQAGSSLSDITTAAKPNADGTYQITGQKIFISGGDHEGSDNFIHLTLARIEGAPSGTKGISLFVVPKYMPQADGSMTDNDVLTAADFQKLGQRGYSTVHLVFGENNGCKGYLVGEANMGLKYMFQMMNAARMDVGMTAASTATAAYYASLQYAQERPQGRRIEKGGVKDLKDEPTTIIHHADVRRMLLKQKAITEGAVSLLLECSLYEDYAKAGPEDQRKDYDLLNDFLTPIAKTYPSEKGKEAIDNGLQILGGYGYCTDFSLQQYYRDVRIMSIYEGTTGIQSIDLLGRKVTMDNGKALQILMQKMMVVIEQANAFENLKPYAADLQKRLTDMQTVLAKLIPMAMQGEYEKYLADATIFMEMASTVVVAYQWLKIAIVAQKALDSNEATYDKTFYKSKLLTMQYFFKYELTKVTSCLETLMHKDETLTIIDDSEDCII